MLAFSLLVAGSFALGVRVANEIGPLALTTLRFWIAAAAIGAAAGLRGTIARETFRAPWRYFTLGGLFAVYFVLMFEGLKTASSVSTSAVFTLTPLMAAGFGWWILGQRPTPRILAALGIGAVGALWVIFRGDLGALLAFDIGRGEAIFFVGCIAHALYTPLVRRLNRGEGTLAFTFGTLLAGGLVLMVLAARDIVSTDWAGLSPLVWVTILYLSLITSAVTFALVQFAAMRLPSSKVMAYTYLTPSAVILWEIALGGAAPPLAILVGTGLTASALILLLRD